MKKIFTCIRWLQPTLVISFDRHFIGAILCIFLSLPAFAQNKIWDKTIGGQDDDILKSVVQTREGGYLLGGISNSRKSGDKSEDSRGGFSNDYWTVKLRADGSKVWDKRYGSDAQDEFTSLQQTQDGGYILGGYTYAGISGDKTEDNKGGPDSNGNGTSDYWVVKLNANGTKAWDRTIGGNGDDVLQAVIQTQDGGYLLGGFSRSGKGGDKTEAGRDTSNFSYYRADYWIVKLKADGTKAWDKTFGGNKDDLLRSLQQTSDGGYILGGFSNSSISGDKTEELKGGPDEFNNYFGDYWVIKLKADGSKEWDKTIGGDKSDELISVQQTSEGGYVLGGRSDSGISGDKTEAQLSGSDFWIVKLNANGTKVWDKTNTSSFGGYVKIFNQSLDEGYLVGGIYYAEDPPGSSTSVRGDDNFWIVKLKADGTKLWEETLGGKGYEELEVLQQTADGNYIVAGTSDSNISGDKSEDSRSQSFDYWVVKVDNRGTITFDPITDKTLGSAPFTLVAKASSGLPVTFSVVAGPATIKGNRITLTGAGTVTVKATLAGDTSGQPEAIQTFIVNAPSSVKKQWDKTFGGKGLDKLTTVVTTPDGGYLLGGTSSSNISGEKSQNSKGKEDYWLVKTTKAGQKVWDKTFGGSDTDQLTALIATPDGGYLVGGYSTSPVSGDKSQASKGVADYWVVKLDGSGKKLWDKTLGGSNQDNLSALLATSDGGYLLGGSSASGKSGDKSEGNKSNTADPELAFSDFWVIKLDAAGNKQWDKTYGGLKADNLAILVAASNGDYLLGGSSASGISGDKSQATRGEEDYWVIRISSNGTKNWDKTFGGIKDYYIGSFSGDKVEFGSSLLATIVATPDGNFLLGGSSNAEKGAEKSQGNLSQDVAGWDAYLQDYWVVKINNQGDKVWDKTFGGISKKVGQHEAQGYYIGNSQLSSIIPTPAGDFLLAGTSDSDKGNDKSQNSKGKTDFWLVKIDDQGHKIGEQTIGGNNFDLLAKGVLDAENNYLLAGNSYSNIGGDKNEVNRDFLGLRYPDGGDYWLVKIKDETLATTAWNRRYGGAGTDNFTVAIKTADGGYLAGGYTNSSNTGDKSQSSQGQTDYWIVKSDKNGQKLWDKRYGGSADDYLNRVIPTQDGGYLLGGSSLSGKSGDKTEGSQGDRDYWVVKVDKQGNQQWDKRFGGSGYDELEKVIQLATGEYVLGGYSNSPNSGDKTQNSQGGTDYWLVKISATGTQIWDKRYGGSANETLGSFTLTRDGGFFLGGTSFSGKSGDKGQSNRGDSDYWAVKTDKDGNLLWEKTYGGTGLDEVYSVGRSHGHYLFLAGTSTSGKSGEKSQASQGGQDYWLIKLDETGTKLWDKSFGGSKDDELRASTYTEEGNYVLAGQSFSEVSGDKSQASQGSSDYWIVQVDTDGNKVTDQRFGGSGDEELRTVLQTNDGGLLLGGRSDSNVSGDRTQPSQGSTDYWLVKVAPFTGTMAATREATLTEEAVAPVKEVQLNAYPNPFADRATIRFTLSQTQPATVKVYDSQGRELATLFQGEVKANQAYEVEWRADKQAAGMYLLQLQTATTRQQQKLLLAK